MYIGMLRKGREAQVEEDWRDDPFDDEHHRMPLPYGLRFQQEWAKEKGNFHLNGNPNFLSVGKKSTFLKSFFVWFK